MDVVLSGELDGIETAEIIKERYGIIPIIFFTSYHDEKIIQRARKVQPVAMIDKFVPFSAVKEAINRCLN